LHDTEALSSAFYWLGAMTMQRDGHDFGRGLTLAERGLAIAEEKGLRLAVARLTRGICIHYAVDGRFAEANRRIEPLLAAMDRSEDAGRPSDLYLSTRWVKDIVLYASDELDAAQAHLEETRALSERAGNRTLRGASAGTLAQLLCLRGDYARARALAEE